MYVNDGGVEKNDEDIFLFVILFVFFLFIWFFCVYVCEIFCCFLFVVVVEDFRENRS